MIPVFRWASALVGLSALAPLHAAIVLQPVVATPTQAVLSYTTSSSSACTIEVSENPTLRPLVHDIDPVLFPGSNLDSRQSGVSAGSARIMVIGKRTVEQAADRKNYSRALQNTTTHYYRVACGTESATGTFATTNIPFGNTYGEGPPADPANPGKALWPDFVTDDRNEVVIDPQTGSYLKRVTMSGDSSKAPNNPRNTSGGFHEFCSPVLSSGGFYHCQLANDWAPFLYAIHPKTGEVRFLGAVYYWGQSLGLKSGLYGCETGGTVMWDDQDPNVVYCPGQSKTDDLVIVKMTYTGNDQPMTATASGSYPPQIPYTAVNLTPDPSSVTAQLKAYAPAYDRTKFGCGAYAFQANHIILSCRRHEQDSFAWIGAYDLGNRQPVGSGGTGHVRAFIKMWEQPTTRWCTNHTAEFLGNVPVTSFAMQWAHGGDVGQGPYTAKLKTAISPAPAGSLTTIDVDSTWNTTWGTPPSGFQPGELLSAFEDHFLMPVQPGDILKLSTGEYVKLVQKISSSHWVVSRGLGRDQSWLYPRAAAAGTTIYAYCSGGFQNDMPDLRYIWWNFLQSPDASSNYKVMFGSHPVARGTTRVDEGYAAVTGNIFTDTSLWSVTSQTIFISPSPQFSSANSVANGNTYQKHPSLPMSNPGWFLDQLPLIGTSAFGTSAQPAVRVDGNAYRYFYNGLDLDGLSRKQLPTLGVCGNNLLRDVSSPGSRIAGDASGAYTYCVANAAGECAPGSRQGDIYFSCPSVTKPYCGDGEMYTGADDVCIGDKANIGLSLAQYKLASDQTGQSIRVLSRFRAQRSWASTANTKPLPDGSWTMVFNPEGKYLLKIPPMPVSDGVDRTRFIPARLNLVPPAGLGVASAVVLFGYTENGAADQYFCTTRQESCVATGTAIADNNPFYYQSTDTYNPAPCSSGCSITVPVIPGRVAYFKVQYMNAAGQVVVAERGVAAESSVSRLPSSSPVPMQLTPAITELAPGQTQQFSAALQGGAAVPVTWKVTPATGTISPGGLYTAPPSITAAQTVTITAASQSDPAKTATAAITLKPATAAAALNLVAVDPSRVYGGASSPYNTVNLTAQAPAAGVTVSLSSSNPALVSLPATVTIAAGQSSTKFSIVSKPVAAETLVTITASYNNVSKQDSLTVVPPVLNRLVLDRSSLAGGTSSANNLAGLSGMAPAGGVTVNLSSSNPRAAAVPASVVIPEGQDTAKFAITASAVAAATTVTITASQNGEVKQTAITILPSSVNRLTFDPPSVVGGTASAYNSVMLNGVAPEGGLTITLSSSNPALASVPASMVVPAGQNSVRFAVTTVPVATPQTVTITASQGGASQQASLTIAPPSVSRVAFDPPAVTGGVPSAYNTVLLNGPAPAGGMTVALSSSNAAIASVPASLVVPAGQNSVRFSVSSTAVAAPVSVTITATQNGVSKSAMLTVAAPALERITLDPSSVVGGATSAYNTVLLDGPAPAGGVTVALSSSNSAVASVPTSVVVPAGQNGVRFAITTTRVTAAASVTITSTLKGVAKTTVLSVLPPA